MDEHMEQGPVHGVFVVGTNREREAAFSIREAVFIDEQGVPREDEYDAHDNDPSVTHFIAYADGTAVGTARLRPIEHEGSPAGKVERVAVLKTARGDGWGTELVKAAEAVASDAGHSQIVLHGQTHAAAFYERLGYETVSDVFVEDGIDHIKMQKPIEAET